MTTTLQRLRVIRTKLLLDHPFFGTLALNLKMIEDPKAQTAWTDGNTLAFDPAFAVTLSDAELLGTMAHEVMHCACGHPWRRGAREMPRWNAACDYAINTIIVDSGLSLPKGALLDRQFAGKAAEWIYDRLPEQSTGQGRSAGDPGGCGAVQDPQPGNDPAETPMTEQDWSEGLTQAINQGKNRGTLPAGLAEKIQALKPKADWRSLLRRYVQEITRADYSWSLPNRRYIQQGLYLPALHSIACGKLAIAVDTSGSIDTVLLSQFCSEVQAIANELQPSSIDVMYCDTKIHRVETFERGDPIEMHAIGRGGTSFIPVFERMNDDPPVCLIYLTDLDGAFPSVAPDYPVIWCTNGSETAPFGDVVPCLT